MSTQIEFTLKIDASKPEQVEALSMLLNVIGGKTYQKPEKTSETLDKSIDSGKKAEKVNKADKATKPKKEQPKEEEQVQPELSQVRAKLSGVLKNDSNSRDKCAAKLKELGAQNVSTLDPQYYDEFIEFLNDLV